MKNLSSRGVYKSLDEIWEEELCFIYSCFDPSFDPYIWEQNLVTLREERDATLKELHR